jgi:2-polyprenyl-3-methyl-5-hydroxy-6-metoxy-1,4-benzoquinol methylase
VDSNDTDNHKGATMTNTITRPDLDQRKLDEFMGTAIGDLSSTVSAALTVIGDQLGLYRSLAAAGPSTVEELAKATGTAVAYLRPWTANQAAGGYLSYDTSTERFYLTPEQAAVLADEDSPNFFPGAMQLALATIRSLPQIQERFCTGKGFGWHEHDRDLFVGTERFFRPGYAVDLVPNWLPAMDGVVETLTQGAVVADVGAGHGASTILMAQAFPNSEFIGSDYHEASMVVARRRAETAGVAARVSFETHDATELPAAAYDLVTMFDCLHDMGDPTAAARAVRRSLHRGGVFLLVEPAAGDRLADNLNPLGRLFYAASTMVCTPASLAQPGGAALGPQAGPAVLTRVLNEAGFTDVSVVYRSPVNLVFQARS